MIHFGIVLHTDSCLVELDDLCVLAVVDGHLVIGARRKHFYGAFVSQLTLLDFRKLQVFLFVVSG